MSIELPFSQEELAQAHSEWGCNCGPASIAAAFGISLDLLRDIVMAAGFKGYMTPTMVRDTFSRLGAKTRESAPNRFAQSNGLAFPIVGVARIQWDGPWTKPGANARWAYRHTHYVASWLQEGVTILDKIDAALSPVIFDVNGGLMDFERWTDEVVPLITKSIPRADGDWFVTHTWELSRRMP